MAQADIIRTAGTFNQFAARLDAQAEYLRQIALNASSGGAEDAASFDSETSALAAQHARVLRAIGKPLLAADAMGLSLTDFPASEARKMEALTRVILDLTPEDPIVIEDKDTALKKLGKELILSLRRIIETEEQ